MKTILLDTNFLLIPGQFNVDIFAEIDRICDFEHEIAVAEVSLQELRKVMVQGSGRDKAAAKLGLELLEHKRVKILESPQKVFKGVDDFLLAIAAEKGFIVATADRELRKRLKEAGVPVIVLRQKQHLQLLR
ncbi:nucleotide-binding protein [Candidatus Woesearchaeota archaeon]|nr:nucleotide-binding protein [Candidatus Woesearchaeota archaeon]